MPSTSSSTASHEGVVDAFRERFGRNPRTVVRAPGRVNLLGAHIDYSEGWVLPIAIDRSVWIASDRAAGTHCTVHALDLDRQHTFDSTDLAPPVATRAQADPTVQADWHDYVVGVSWLLRRELEVQPCGLDAVFSSTVPIGSGVSSSAALDVAMTMTWAAHLELDIPPLKCAQLAQLVENDYVGVGCGIMDPFASVHGERGGAMLIDCRSLEHEVVHLPDHLRVLVVDSGKQRSLAGSSFNDRRAECEQAVALLGPFLPELRTLRDLTTAQLEEHRERLPDPLPRRAEHVIHECQRVLDGAAAIRQGDIERLGEAISDSQRSSRDLYEVSVDELNVLTEAAWDVVGCYGARLCGAGFGGCVMALCDEDRVEATEHAMTGAFRKAFGRPPRQAFACRPGPGAEALT